MGLKASPIVPSVQYGLWGRMNLPHSLVLSADKISDQIFTGIMGGEAKSPRYSMAHATKLVPIRVSVVYMLSITFISILVPQDDPRLFGGTGDTAASPFVIALDHAGSKCLTAYRSFSCLTPPQSRDFRISSIL
jgi:hypothetical protein